jgi:hypothetical protein
VVGLEKWCFPKGSNLYDEAMKARDKTTEIDPQDADAWSDKGFVKKNSEKHPNQMPALLRP